MLRETLTSLSSQSYPSQQYEVVIVADGCSDGTAEMVVSLQTPYQLRLCEIPGNGAAQARNTGAGLAKGELLLFLDDDILAAPSLIEAHVNAHIQGEKQVVIGYLPVRLNNAKDYFSLELLEWWEAMFDAARLPSHRFKYSDLLSGNFSITKDFFLRVGGFDPAFQVHEDYELGIRLLKADAIFRFEEKAWGFHDERSDLKRALERKRQEGIADVQLGQAYPEVIPALLMSRLLRYSLFPSRVLRVLAFDLPEFGDRLVIWFESWLVYLERARLLGTWRRILYGLLGYYYWRGVDERLGSTRGLKTFLNRHTPMPAPKDAARLQLDIGQGLEVAEQILNELRPESVEIVYNGELIGVIPSQAGSERLHGDHLRAIFGTDLAKSLLRTLASANTQGLPPATRIRWLAEDRSR